MGSKKTPAGKPDKKLLRLTVKKNIIGEYSTELENQFRTELSTVNCPVVLDLSTITIVDSRGVALCVGLYKECQQKNLQISIDVSPELAQFFKLLKLDRILQFNEKGSGK